MHRRTRLPKSSTARSTSSTGQPFLTLWPVRCSGALSALLFTTVAAGPGGWWILDEPQLHLGEDIVVPDIAGWRRERMPVFSRCRLHHAGSRLGMRSALPVDAQIGPGRQERGVRPGRRRIPMVRRPDRPLTGSEGAAQRKVGGDCRAAWRRDSFAAAI